MNALFVSDNESHVYESRKDAYKKSRIWTPDVPKVSTAGLRIISDVPDYISHKAGFRKALWSSL